MNELTNTTNVAADLAAQVASGNLEITEVSGGVKGKIITGAVATGLVAGAGVGGWFLGRRHERKLEDRIAAIEEYLSGADDFEEEDDEEEEPADTKKKKTKKSKAEDEVEEDEE